MDAPLAGSFVCFVVRFVVGLILLALLIWIWYKIAKNFAKIAADKGYTEKKWFHYCFWLGIIGMLMVCAMPDKKLQRND